MKKIHICFKHTFLIISLTIFSCQKKEKQVEKKDYYFEYYNYKKDETGKRIGTINIPYCKKKIRLEGDTIAYMLLNGFYIDRNNMDSLLVYAKIMSDNYDSGEASLDAYFSILMKYNNRISKPVKKEVADEIIHYLTKAVKAKSNQARELLGQYYYYGIYVQENGELGEHLLKGGWLE